jgi:hypothetical protein
MAKNIQINNLINMTKNTNTIYTHPFYASYLEAIKDNNMINIIYYNDLIINYMIINDYNEQETAEIKEKIQSIFRNRKTKKINRKAKKDALSLMHQD